ncbi:multidrug efflux pump subunit AcrA (membrane-fusion protein) [Neorhizobium sp. 2083]|uniref:efflux RND transporter periplasmic adaptor subunit n=1 Tax=Neorhizobium sp. 2083 TaxID=2817762 RepID=UPI0028603A41|nr:HlyD family efflux transporter periplasmic adaptor subunit [Neorhizobium sp. 2083]MDR6818771.1 multidrug efflux pump subunit AcrA (membrane-fusion protein) [Neorhizobium sp. 2083]
MAINTEQRQQPCTEATAMPIRVSGTDARRSSARLWSVLAAGSAIIVLGSAAWFWQSGNYESALTVKSSKGVQPEQAITVKPQAVSSNLNIAGTIAAGKAVAIVAPFDGLIREKRVQLGDHVQAGDVLLVMDTSEIANRYRDAQSAYLKAAMAAQAMEKWDSGPDVLRAKRALESAQTSLAALERQLTELKGLLDQGIISRNEYDGTVQQRNAQQSTVASAKEELESTLQRGNADNRQLLALDLENAQSRLRDLKAQMAGANVATAVSGILTRPPATGNNQDPPSLEPGANTTRGTALFSIADISSFTVTGAVDEVDVNRVQIGQPVDIISDAFPGTTLLGRIVNVSAEATVSRTNAAVFDVRAQFVIDDDTLRKAVRLGMSARMTVKTYFNSAALIVPPLAVLNAGAAPQIRIRRAGKDTMVPVLLGSTFPDGVEVVSGLNPGDIVLLP